MKNFKHTPIVDIFAGPGGLSEGFGAFLSGSSAPFRTVLSIEKDPIACQTLQLRKFYRSFDSAPDGWLDFLRGDITRAELYERHPEVASVSRAQTWQAELGVETTSNVSRRVRAALNDESNGWVLVGGPPCQAYSLAGRSRMRTTRPDFESDERHFLYREYLQIVARHRPAVFVMENVRGILSSTHGGTAIFDRITRDLRRPAVALGLDENRGLQYRLYGLAPTARGEYVDGRDPEEHFLLKAEQHGVPQARHRVIIVGVRSDLDGAPDPLDATTSQVSVNDVIGDLPALRSRLSRERDSWDSWKKALQGFRQSGWMQAGKDSPFGAAAAIATRALRGLTDELFVGAMFVDHRRTTIEKRSLSDWYRGDALGLSHHESRGHMLSDLHRYLFASCFAAATGRSPALKDFPKELHPKHANVQRALSSGMFADRFRVQCSDRPSSTVTSHISKDGHYFIHPDPGQCRSLTVREAARLQSFPDSYWFCGNRTQQYHQVGNAVPPLLARQIAARIYDLIRRT